VGRLYISLALVAAPQLANAQDPEASEESDEEVVVTGSRAQQRSALDSPVPVDVFDDAQLRSAGAVANEVGQALAVVAPSFFFPRQSNSGSSDHVRAGQLRGLSPDQMLVLVNGHRRHTSAVVNSETKIGRGTAAVDFNAIPLGAIGRIEVLRDGAGAQYGSDAIAGVVNLVLDDDPDSSVGAITAGTHLTYEGPIEQTLVDGETLTLEAETGFHVGDEGFVRLGLEAVVREGTNRAGFDGVPFWYASTYNSTAGTYASIPDNTAVAGGRNYAMGDPRTRSGALWLNSEIPLGGVTLYAFGTGSLRATRGAAFFRYPQDYRNVTEIYPDGFLPITTGEAFDLSLNAGLRGESAGWDIDFGTTWGRNVFQFGAINSLNPSLGADSPTEFDSGSYRFDQINLDLVASRGFDLSLAGPLTVAVGLGSRQELYATFAGQPESYEAGPVDAAIGAQGATGLAPGDERNLARGVYGAFADLSAQLVKQWFVDVAGRYEWYSDFGSTWTGKASTLLSPVDKLGLRASVSNSFRAPGLAQIGFSDRSTNFGEDRALVLTRTSPVDDPIAQALGATELRPERAFDVSAGLVVGPVEGVSLTVDAFRVQVNDRITLSERIFGQGVVDAIAGLPGSEGVESVRYFTNAIDTETMGIEGVFRLAREAGPGVLTLDAGASFFQTKILSFADTPSELTAIDDSFALVGVEEINTVETAAPTNKQVVTGVWDTGDFAGLLRLSRFGSATRVFNFGGGFEPEQTYGDEYQLDAQITVRPSGTVELALGGTNLLDEYPDLSSADINFFGNLPYDVLSPIGINGRYLYLRTRVQF
jgi:iron complex outermembrane recepter protein